MADPTVSDAIEAAAGQYGLNPAVLKGIASIESSWDPRSNYDKPSTQYKGLFQIGKDEWNRYGGGGDIYNPVDNASAAAHMLADHAQWYRDQYGQEPNPGKLYMMHLQGRGFVQKGTMTNVGGNPYPGMRGPQTPESFENGWSGELAKRIAPFGSAASIYGPAGAPTASATGPGVSPAVALAQAQPPSAPYFAGAAQPPAAAGSPAASSGAAQATAAGDLTKLGEGLLAPQLGAPPQLQLPPAFRPQVPQLKSLATIKPSIYFPRG